MELAFKNLGDGDFARIPVEGNIGKRRPVCWTGRTVSGLPSVCLADATNPDKRPAIGVTMHDVTDGKLGYVLFFGLVKLDSQLSTGTVYLGKGTIVSEAPEYAQSLGSVGAGWLLLNPDSGE